MAETFEQRLGIDRCERAVETLFALTLMDLADFKWGHQNGHKWEVGRWPGFRLTLLAQPQWGPHRPPFAICPLPGNGNEVPFIVLIALGEGITSLYSDTRGHFSVDLPFDSSGDTARYQVLRTSRLRPCCKASATSS
jgi:hypothetical protein